MKTILKTIAASLLVMIFMVNNSFAQDIVKNDRVVVQTNMVTAATSISDPGNTRISSKFAAIFPAAQYQQWTSDSKGYWVSFTNEGRKTRAGFNNNGQLNYVIAACTMEQLSGDFNNYISKNYESYHLLNAIEINAFGEKTEQVILESVTGFVTLISTKEGISVIQKTIKSK